MTTQKWLRLLVLPAFLATSCKGNSSTPVAPTPTPTTPTPTTPAPTPIVPQTVYFVGAGDIADCSAETGIHAEATAKLIDKMPEAVVFTAGDNAYFDATAGDYMNCYHPRWGRFKGRTNPSPGNHEYQSAGAAPYFNYFAGQRTGGNGAGYYSYTLGNWHIVSLNSNIDVSAGSAQVNWLKQDLLDNQSSPTAKCTLAYWHHPLFTSGPSAGSTAMMRDVWQVLFDRGVDVIVNGHDHLYERFRAQTPDGLSSPNAGIVEYIVGTGGAPPYDFGPILPNSVFKLTRTYGVLYFTLRDVGWDSVFVEAGTEARLDLSMNNLCH